MRSGSPAANTDVPHAGSAGGVVEAFCLAPIDVVKTRLQLDGKRQYKGILHCGTSIFKNEGYGALWKGVVPFATHLTFKYALRMGSNSFYQNLLRDSDGNLNNYRRLAAGAMAGVTEAICIVTPFEVVKIRLQQQRGLDKAALKYKVRAWPGVHCMHGAAWLVPDARTAAARLVQSAPAASRQLTTLVPTH
jgi:solute carrier family 25 (mitochondrial citrate transporter), member 1